MTVNLNRGILQGFVASVTPVTGGARVVLRLRDDYRDSDNNMNERTYFLPVMFFGIQSDNLVKLVESGDQLTVEVKIGTYKPKDAEYSQVSLMGTQFYLSAQQNPEQKASKQKTTSNKSKPTSKSPAPWDDDEDDDSPGW